VIAADSFRPPAQDDTTRAAYKDWLHLNVFDHASGCVGLVNVSLSGAPDDPRSRAVGAALLHVPDRGWVGNLDIRGFDEVTVGSASMAFERVALAVDHVSGTVTASARFPEDAFSLDVKATSAVPAFAIEEPQPLGPGWFSWYAVGRLTVAGEAVVGDRRFDLAGATGYHDHNWGRWHWGQDLGWEWGAFVAADPGPSVILMRTTDREHETLDSPLVVAYLGARRCSFVGASVEIEHSGRLENELRRLPGSMAVLHGNRATPRLPARVNLRADDGRDTVELELEAQAAAQLVTADSAFRGYGFIHELVGEFQYRASIGGVHLEGSGLGVFEYAD
jgi:hypothetical protein